MHTTLIRRSKCLLDWHGDVLLTSLRVQEQLQNGEIRMNAGAWPALAYPGDPPGVDFDVEDIQEGLLRGHLLKRVCFYFFYFRYFV